MALHHGYNISEVLQQAIYQFNDGCFTTYRWDHKPNDTTRLDIQTNIT